MGLQSVQLQLQYTWMFSSLSEKVKDNQKKKKTTTTTTKNPQKTLGEKMSSYHYIFGTLNFLI